MLLYVAESLDAQTITEVQRYKTTWATQAVAVDAKHFYAIENQHITKYNMQGDSLTTWYEADKDLIRHFNSGVVVKGKLYCAHSNFPKYPMASSIEVFDTKTMEHVETISFGIDVGSCVWVVPGKKCWYVFFAHYDKSAEKTKWLPDNANQAQLVQYDLNWQKMNAWILPDALIDELRPNSVSGAVLIDDTFYCTGHDYDHTYCYLVKLPPYGTRLQWVGTIESPFPGQGVAVDPDGNIWGIDRKKREVIKATFTPDKAKPEL